MVHFTCRITLKLNFNNSTSFRVVVDDNFTLLGVSFINFLDTYDRIRILGKTGLMRFFTFMAISNKQKMLYIPCRPMHLHSKNSR